MTEKQKNFKIGLIKAIHSSDMYKNIYANDRALYEIMLENRFGVKSSKDMTIEELKSLKEFMCINTLQYLAPQKITATQNQVVYILDLWKKNSKNKDIASLFEYYKKVFKKDIQDLEDITRREAGLFIGFIKKLKPRRAENNTYYRNYKIEQY